MSLPMEHLIAIMVHEVGHIALRHLAAVREESR